MLWLLLKDGDTGFRSPISLANTKKTETSPQQIHMWEEKGKLSPTVLTDSWGSPWLVVVLSANQSD